MFDRNTADLVCRSKVTEPFRQFQQYDVLDVSNVGTLCRGAAVLFEGTIWRFFWREVNANLRENGFNLLKT